MYVYIYVYKGGFIWLKPKVIVFTSNQEKRAGRQRRGKESKRKTAREIEPTYPLHSLVHPQKSLLYLLKSPVYVRCGHRASEQQYCTEISTTIKSNIFIIEKHTSANEPAITAEESSTSVKEPVISAICFQCSDATKHRCTSNNNCL